jgi:hypothetical protein
MKVLEILAALPAGDKPSFLLIGGHAVNLYGYSRTTHDVDLLVSRSGREQMKSVLLAAGYSIFREEGAFIQMTPASEADWPVDFMVVTDETFLKLAAASREKMIGEVTVRVPSVEHLIALKLHVLKQGLPHRTIKDFCDVQGLVEQNAVDLNSSEMRGIFERYGNEDLYHRIKVACGQQ